MLVPNLCALAERLYREREPLPTIAFQGEPLDGEEILGTDEQRDEHVPTYCYSREHGCHFRPHLLRMPSHPWGYALVLHYQVCLEPDHEEPEAVPDGLGNEC